MITNLDISQASKITDSSVIEMAHHLKCLEHLQLKRCARITDQGIKELARNLPRGLSFLTLSAMMYEHSGTCVKIWLRFAAKSSHT